MMKTKHKKVNKNQDIIGEALFNGVIAPLQQTDISDGEIAHTVLRFCAHAIASMEGINALDDVFIDIKNDLRINLLKGRLDS